jgi:hypothetical protein
MVALDYIVNIFYFFDIIINFRTSFLSKSGEEIFDVKKIAI